MNDPGMWAVVLAGGDGKRLRPLARMVTGEDRPKQFCPLYGGKTLLTHTRDRLAAVVPAGRTVFAVVHSHESYYEKDLANVQPSRIVVQPSNRGTTAAFISSLQRVIRLGGDPLIGFFPTDHHYADEPGFAASARLAVQIAGGRPEQITLFGAVPDHPEPDYGWIEPGLPLGNPFTDALYGVRRFWEKPSTPLAEALFAHGCLWNTFVMFGRASAFWEALKMSVPRVMEMFITSELDTGTWKRLSDFERKEKVYAALAPGDFSRQVLAVSTGRLAVLRVDNLGWSDLGTPERVRFALAGAGSLARFEAPAPARDDFAMS